MSHVRREGHTVLALVDTLFRRNADRFEPGFLETKIGIDELLLVHQLVQQNSNLLCHTDLLWYADIALHILPKWRQIEMKTLDRARQAPEPIHRDGHARYVFAAILQS